MRRFKLKVLRVSLLVGILINLLDPLPLTSYRNNAVESNEFSVNCETYRGLNENYDSYLLKNVIPTLTPTISPTPINKEMEYTKEDLKLLAGIIENEAGANFCNNKFQRAIASVVLNRVNYGGYYPDTIKAVIFQDGQYAIDKERFNHPSKRAYKNAKYVLEHGSTIPEKCIFQSEFVQGKIYEKFETIISTTYICYKD